MRSFLSRPVLNLGLVVGRCFSTLPDLKVPASLPTLSFDYKEGISPVFSPRQMELHYTKHHQAYIDKLNAIGKEFDGQTVEEVMCKTVENPAHRVLFNQAAQHFNHSFFWLCLTPNGSPMPAELETAIKTAFGSVDAFKEAFAQSAVGNFGSGWTWLCVNPTTKSLVIENTSNAGCPVTSGLRPIFTLDVWEHAYYKDFENRRPDYTKEIWKIVNWNYVEKAYKIAIQ